MKNKRNLKQFIFYKKIDISILIGMIAFAFIICFNFCKPHFSQDAYYHTAYGYEPYIQTFLVSNRMFSALLFKLCSVLNIQVITEMKIMGIVLTFIMAISWFILYKIIMKLLRKKTSLFYNILVALASFLIVFNICTAEGLLFVGDGSMPFGILFAILGAMILTTDKKSKYVVSLILVTISGIFYQGTSAIFVLLALVFISIKNKGNIKLIIKDTIIIGVIYSIAMIANFIGIKIWTNILQFQTRTFSFPSIEVIIETIIKFGKIMLVYNCGIGPKYWYLITLVIMTIVFICNNLIRKRALFEILEYFTLVVLSILIPIIPIIITPVEVQYLEPRMAMCFGSIIGIMVMFLISTIEIEKNKNIVLIITAITIVNCIINSIYMVYASSSTLGVNKVEKIIAEQIINEIKEYENKTQIEIKGIGIAFDKTHTPYYEGDTQLRGFNLRSLGTGWAVKEVITTYSGKQYNSVTVPEEIIKEFSNKDWNQYNKEQLVFDGENLYIGIF